LFFKSQKELQTRGFFSIFRKKDIPKSRDFKKANKESAINNALINFYAFQSPKLTEKEAKDLARNSYEAFNYLLEGGEKSTVDEKIFKLRILDQNIDSEQKVIALLKKYFTSERARIIYETLGFETVNGMFYKELSDICGIFIWENAIIYDIKFNKNMARAVFLVPFESETGTRYKETVVEYIYLKDQGWRINSQIY
jgi:hypothetical protein